MEKLLKHLESYASCVNIQLTNPCWHLEAKIPSRPGWYFIRSTTPLAVLQKQMLWSTIYRKKGGGIGKVANYDIANRARRYAADLSSLWNIRDVYSGLAAKLNALAREHTFPDPGTGGLALSRYPALQEYEWQFFFGTLDRHRPKASCPKMVLRLGEQIWRAKNGWPLLCLV